MKTLKWLAPLTAAGLLLLSACGSGESSSAADGAKEMKHHLAAMKTDMEAGDSAKVKEGAEELEESWEKFEDGVKDKNADLYKKVEDPLHAIEAGAKQAALDKAALGKAINDLDAALAEVENLK